MQTYPFAPAVVIRAERYAVPEWRGQAFRLITEMVGSHLTFWETPTSRENVGPLAAFKYGRLDVQEPASEIALGFLDRAEGSKLPFLYQLAAFGIVTLEGIFFTIGQTPIPGPQTSPLNLFAFDRESIRFLAQTCAGLDEPTAHYGMACDFHIGMTRTGPYREMWKATGDIYIETFFEALLRLAPDVAGRVRLGFMDPPTWPGQPAICRAMRCIPHNWNRRALVDVFSKLTPSRELLWYVLSEYGRIVFNAASRHYGGDNRKILNAVNVPSVGLQLF